MRAILEMKNSSLHQQVTFNNGQLFQQQLTIRIDLASVGSLTAPCMLCLALKASKLSFQLSDKVKNFVLKTSFTGPYIHFLLFLSLQMDSHILVIDFKVHDLKISSTWQSQYCNPLWDIMQAGTGVEPGILLRLNDWIVPASPPTFPYWVLFLSILPSRSCQVATID